MATFCFNVSRNIPIRLDTDTSLTLVYVEDVIDNFIKCLKQESLGVVWTEIVPSYQVRLHELARIIENLKTDRDKNIITELGDGLTKKLHATFLSYIPENKTSRPLALNSDSRGDFVEVWKTKVLGQFSFFTAGVGVTRGEHYHHTKNENFVVVSGRAEFSFRHLVEDRSYSIVVDSSEPKIVESLPGWVHKITNAGDEKLVVMLWANEVFDEDRADTHPEKV